MTKLTLEAVKVALLKLAAHYPEAKHNGQTIGFLSDDYYSDMMEENISLEQFQAAVKAARKTCHFFPKVSDILQAAEKLTEEREAISCARLPEYTSEQDLTPEEIACNLRRVENIKSMLAGKLTLEETLGKVASPKRFNGRMQA